MAANLCTVQGAIPLGHGGFGQVWRVYSDVHKQHVARKYFLKARWMKDEKKWYELLQNGFAQQTNIIKMFGSMVDNNNNHHALELEFADEGTLWDLAFVRNGGGSIELNKCPTLTDAKTVQDLVTGCLEALRFLHDDAQIVHNDLKPGNILLHGGVAKLADFGLSSFKMETASNRIGTFGYTAPEVFENSQETEGKTDIFSLGVTLFEVFEGMPPTPMSKSFHEAWTGWLAHRKDSSVSEWVDRLQRAASQFFKPHSYSSRLLSGINLGYVVVDAAVPHIVAEMIRVDVETRPTAAECLALLKRFSPRHSATPQPTIRLMEEDEDEYEEIAAQSPAQPDTSSTSSAPVPAPAATPANVKVRSVSVLAIDTPTPPSMSMSETQVKTEELEQMLRLAHLHAKGKDVREKKLLALQAKLRVKSTFKKNVFVYQLMDVLHKHPEFASRREKVFLSVTQTSKHWWGDHKAERAALRAKYGLK